MKLGIVGTGMIVQEFFTITPYLKEIELTAICSVRKSVDAIREYANKYNVLNAFNNYEEFLNSEIDTVYVALPNTLHFKYAQEALLAGKNVIMEKPFTTNYKEAVILSDLARDKGLYLFEAITTLYLPNYKKIKETLPILGDIKIVQCNYSQYSSRYNSFKEGNILPAFDPAMAGGALMDLNIYNIHYVVGLFGKPNNVSYFPNIERGIDTSGIVILEYDTFVCTLIGAKDCKAPIANNIQGNNGCIYQDNPANVCTKFEVLMNDGTSYSVNENKYEHRMVHEFLAFEHMISNNNLDECYKLIDHTLTVCDVLTAARRKAGIVFEGDSI